MGETNREALVCRGLRWHIREAKKILTNSSPWALSVPTELYTLVQNAAELRERAREGVFLDNWVVREEEMPVMTAAMV